MPPTGPDGTLTLTFCQWAKVCRGRTSHAQQLSEMEENMTTKQSLVLIAVQCCMLLMFIGCESATSRKPDGSLDRTMASLDSFLVSESEKLTIKTAYSLGVTDGMLRCMALINDDKTAYDSLSVLIASEKRVEELWRQSRDSMPPRQ